MINKLDVHVLEINYLGYGDMLIDDLVHLDLILQVQIFILFEESYPTPLSSAYSDMGAETSPF